MPSNGSVAPPEQWPAVVVEKYEPIQILGKGGFASVCLARCKDGAKNKLVAIKVVGSKNATSMERGYAHREIDILSEISHPGIMKLLEHWEPSPKEHKCAAVMALSYHRGPSLEYILKRVGAPAFNFCRVVSAQLVDVVAFLHSHAVIHRDIKPDNMIITGADFGQEELYQDPDDTPDWAVLCEKWHLTLLDFGFARPLGPNDIGRDVGLRKSVAGELTSPTVPNGLDKALHARMIDSSLHKPEKEKLARLDRSSSKVTVRKMSALGNKFYAAPEVQNGVKDTTVDISIHKKPKNTLSNFVSDYGMVADAFSVGATIRYILTGVAPCDNIDEVIWAQKNPAAVAARWIGKKMSRSKEMKKRGKTYRKIKACPREAVTLVLGMTHRDPNQRTSVRAARLYPWIDDALESTVGPVLDEIQFLKCAMKDPS